MRLFPVSEKAVFFLHYALQCAGEGIIFSQNQMKICGTVAETGPHICYLMTDAIRVNSLQKRE